MVSRIQPSPLFPWFRAFIFGNEYPLHSQDLVGGADPSFRQYARAYKRVIVSEPQTHIRPERAVHESRTVGVFLCGDCLRHLPSPLFIPQAGVRLARRGLLGRGKLFCLPRPSSRDSNCVATFVNAAQEKAATVSTFFWLRSNVTMQGLLRAVHTRQIGPDF